MNRSLLDVRNLRVRYGRGETAVTAVRDVSFSLDPGRALGIVGESGSGKSSVASAVLGLLGENATVSGDIVFDQVSLLTLAPSVRRSMLGSRIGSVFQDPFTALNPAIRIGPHIAEAMIQHLGVTRTEAMARAVDLLAEMGINRPGEVARAYPHQLSGGMKQRALIAAALACEPKLVILDEPTTALDVTVEAQILHLLAELRVRKNISILFISHNLGVVRRLCDDVAVLYASQIVETGPTEDVLRHPAHPYSKGLLASMPPLQSSTRAFRLPAIPGQMPGQSVPETGCVFAARCPFAEASCSEGAIDLMDLGRHRTARCWKSDRLGDWPEIVVDAVNTRGFQRGDSLVNLTSVKKVFDAKTRLGAWRFSFKGGLPTLKPAPLPVAAVNGVSMSISPGEVLGLVGESGCGKSTLGRLILQLLRQSAGSVEFDGADLGLKTERELRLFRQQAQIVFQNVGSSLNPRLSIQETLERPLVLFDLVPSADRARRVEELLGMVRLPASYRTRFPHELSGGERQRVAIARALATEPRFIVCDEPVSALDVSVQAAVVNLLADLRDQFGLAYLFISHDLAVVAQLSDRIAVMYRGRICEIGSVDDVLSPPHHPYTKALLASLAHDTPAETEGAGSQNAVSGCAFRSRCPHRISPLCDTVTPELRAVTDTHLIACHSETVWQWKAMAPAITGTTAHAFESH